MTTTHSEHNDILELLPWYANGTLSDTETRRVREHLDRHPELMAEAERTGALIDALGEDATVPMLTHDRIRNVMGRLEQHSQPAQPLRRLAQGARSWWQNSSSIGLPLAASVAIVLLAVVILPLPVGDDGNYRTLSSERPPVSLHVELAQDVDTAGAQALFESLALDAQHRAGSVYVVTLPADIPVSDLFDTLQQLRANDRVVEAKALTEED